MCQSMEKCRLIVASPCRALVLAVCCAVLLQPLLQQTPSTSLVSLSSLSEHKLWFHNLLPQLMLLRPCYGGFQLGFSGSVLLSP